MIGYEPGQGRLIVPPGLRVPRLEQLLGVRLDQLDYPAIEALVLQRMAEDLTLEFKRELYASDDRGRAELAKDVAAMANAAGGLILLGVDEDKQGRAHGLTRVALSDDERRRISQVCAQWIAPVVPDLTPTPLPDPDEPTQGVFALLVPASESAPHGIASRERYYAWPVREDTHTRWMREPELAARYRDRFAGDRRSIDRVDATLHEGVDRLDRDQRGWLAVAVAPTRPGRLAPHRDAAQRSRDWLQGTAQRLPTGALLGSDVAIGRRRVVHSDVAYCAGPSTDRRLELHTDGAGFAAIALSDMQTLKPAPNMSPCPLLTLRAIAVEKWTLTLLGLLGQQIVGDPGSRGDQVGGIGRDAGRDGRLGGAVPVPRVLLPDGQLDSKADRGPDVEVLTSWADRLGRTNVN
jgi:Putative DNA-binding domain